MSASAESLPGAGLAPHPTRIDVPGATLEQIYVPGSVAELSQLVGAAAKAGEGLLIVGGRTRIGWARPSGRLRHAVSTTGLSGIDEFEPDEGVLHAAAGTPIAALREAAAAEGWELPLDPPGPHATLGGTIATAAIGPRAQAFGSVSDAILGLEVVDGEGVATRCGGRVVKNVTGYDLAKLHCGAHGALGVLTGAWLRLRPAPAVREVVEWKVPLESEAFERARAAARLSSVRALVWREVAGDNEATVSVEIGGSESAVAHDRAVLSADLSLSAAEADRVDRLRDERAGAEESGSEAGAVRLRARVLGSKCEGHRRLLREAGASQIAIDPGLGVLVAELPPTDPAVLLSLREAAEAAQGLAGFERLPDAWQAGVDPFGEVAGTGSLLSTLKVRFDPADVLNPGRMLTPASQEGSG